MHATLPLLAKTDFPRLRRSKLETLQINLGYKCNQSCQHCHVNSSPQRTEMMDRATIDLVLEVIRARGITTIDLTGGAPEMNVEFKHLVRQARAMGVKVIDRCNLTILSEPGYEGLAEFLAEQGVDVVASLPCYSVENVDKQRGDGVFDRSIAGLQQLNSLGYAKPGTGLSLNLVYNPQGPSLPPPQAALEADYKRELKAHFGIEFNQLFALTNMPIQRFGSMLISKGTFAGYMDLLKGAYKPENLATVMCRTMISVDYQGFIYDCDFNQMLGLSAQLPADANAASTDTQPLKPRPHLQDLLAQDPNQQPIAVADHCYGCTAGQGSSCGGALESKAA